MLKTILIHVLYKSIKLTIFLSRVKAKNGYKNKSANYNKVYNMNDEELFELEDYIFKHRNDR
ncbi:hypothetical protein CD138_06965 [Staphylococcus intermedius NCTC 11048]|nr:hypothetical protein B4W76_03195 [Staphylococcus intermedius]PNZ52242.1 hypothetical protein CD138_06965 [Staphylococcus intermedius NCTC 11048]